MHDLAFLPVINTHALLPVFLVPRIWIITYPDKLIYLNFQPPEVVSRYRDPQPQMGINYSYLFTLGRNIYKC